MSEQKFKGLSQEDLEKAAGLDSLRAETASKTKVLTEEELRKAAGLDTLKTDSEAFPNSGIPVTQVTAAVYPGTDQRNKPVPSGIAVQIPVSDQKADSPAGAVDSAAASINKTGRAAALTGRPDGAAAPMSRPDSIAVPLNRPDGGIASMSRPDSAAAPMSRPDSIAVPQNRSDSGIASYGIPRGGSASSGSAGIGQVGFVGNAAANTGNSVNDRKSKLKINKTPEILDRIPLLGVLYRAVVELHIGVLIWIIINTCVFCCVGVLIMNDRVQGILFGIFVYLVSMIIATSPAGERMLRKQADCHRLMDPLILKRLEPIFDRIYRQARELSPQISKDITLYISDDTFANAFACGRRTICITRGLLDLSDDQIEGILAHEFGHLAARDTDESLAIMVGNVFVAGTLTIIGTCLYFICKIAASRDDGDGMEKLGFLLKIFVASTLVYLWTRLGMLFSLRASRQEEYRADHYGWVLGKEEGLISGLAALDRGDAPSGVWKAISSTHPDTADRIMRLRSYGQETA